MPGGLMQLVSYGAEDLFLTGNPQMTFFKVVYRRYTNFATEFIEVYFDTKPSFDPVQITQMKVKVPRHADLINTIFLVYDLPAIASSTSLNYTTTEGTPGPIIGQNFKWVPDIGNRVINNVQLTIGGQVIDKLYGQWLSIWNDLTLPEGKKPYYKSMIGNNPLLTRPESFGGNTHINNPCSYCTATRTLPAETQKEFLYLPRQRLYIPINFWFTENPGLSLPLIALQSVDVEIQIEFNPLNELYTISSPAPDPTLLAYDCILNSSSTTTGNSCGIVDTDRSDFYNREYYTNISPKNFYENFNYSVTNPDFGTPSNFERFFGEVDVYPNLRTMFNYFVEQGLIAENNFITEWSQNCYFLINYVYLDDDERVRMAQNSHEYLITQTNREEFQGLSGENVTAELRFTHPVKEMIWCFQHDTVSYFNKWNTYTFNQLMRAYANNRLAYQFYENIPRNSAMDSFDNGFNIMYNGTLLLNGHERFKPRDSAFFGYVQPYLYHTGNVLTRYIIVAEPGLSTIAEPFNIAGTDSGVYVYSFSLDPENVQPSGTCNFSRINKVEFNFDIRGGSQETGVKYNLYIYVRSMNVLRIMGGIGGLVFAN